MDSAALADMIDAISQSGNDVNSVTIIRNGYLISEAYFYPYQKGIPHAINSCTKGFVSALAGIAVSDGSIHSADDSVLDYFTGIDNVDERKKALKISNLMNMTTGLDWQFDGNVSTNEMLQSEDWTKFTLDLPMREEPGGSFNYCNGAAQVMSAVIQRAEGKSAAELFADKMKALGIKDMVWNSSPDGVSIGYSGIFMHPDDAAKFGYLYLNKGNWNGEQLIPEKWVEASTKQQVTAGWNPIFPGYGSMWWTTRFGGYAALGFGGNYIFVVPEKNLVVVFTGGIFDNSKLFYPGELMEEYVIPSIKSDTPLQSNEAAASELKNAVDAVQNAPAPAAVTLPEIALSISGKTYGLDNGGTVIFQFEEGSDEFTMSLADQLYTVSMGGVFNIMDVGSNGSLPDHNHLALTGGWFDEDTLDIEVWSLEDGYVKTYTANFHDDSIDIHTTANIGMDESYSGTLQP